MSLRACCFAAALISFIANGQTVNGVVRDSNSNPIPGVTVFLLSQDDPPRFSAKTDAEGSYSLRPLAAGSYKIRAQKAGYSAASFGPFVLGVNGSKQIDLMLAAQAEFFDEPNFVVAGVTDATNLGGHGAMAVAPSWEALTKATASMKAPGESPADIEERKGNALAAVREYQRAAELDPSETNLFNWGADLLVHRAAPQAATVFAKGHRLYPRSVRMLLGLGAAWYSVGSYQEAARYLFDASDLNPDDPTPYLFLGEVQANQITHLDGYVERMARFAQRLPNDPLGNYYYAVALWQRRSGGADADTLAKVRVLLEKAVRLDPKLGEAYLQLGKLYSSLGDRIKEIDYYKKALETGPKLQETHYRLAQAYLRIGDKQSAKAELDLHQQLVKMSAAEADRERRQIQQFIFSLKDPSRH